MVHVDLVKNLLAAQQQVDIIQKNLITVVLRKYYGCPRVKRRVLVNDANVNGVESREH